MALIKIPILDKLVHLIEAHVNIRDLIHDITLIKIIHIHNDPSKELIWQDSEDKLSLNPEKILKLLPPDQQKEFVRLFLDAQRENNVPLVDKEYQERVDDIAIKQNTSSEITILSYFKDKIPPDDFDALRSSLYLRDRFKEGAGWEEISRLKMGIIKVYSRRGRNISDLCSAGYFDTLIRKIYEDTISSGYSKEEFLLVYNIIIEEGILAVFVSEGMTEKQIEFEIEGKIRRNKEYGLHFLYVHGIGSENLRKIRNVTYNLKDQYRSSMKFYSKEVANILSVKISF
jgi:hypothetical protein